MNTTSLKKSYEFLKPEERFALILSASERGDELEKQRLRSSCKDLVLRLQDFAPYSKAFEELSTMMFIELLDHAAQYLEDLNRPDTPSERNEGDDKTIDERHFDLALATGHVMKTKMAGWKQFCEKLNVPSLLMWEHLPGYERLQRALKIAEKAAYTPEGFLVWLNRIRPDGEPEITETRMTPENLAQKYEAIYLDRVRFWSG